MRGQWIQIAENKILVKCGLPLSLSFVFGVNRFFNCQLLYNIAPFCPRFVVGNVVRLFLPTSSNTAYSLSRIGILDGFSVSPRRWTGAAFVLGKYRVSSLRQGHDPSAGTPSALDKA